jgi:hypothetical protein
MKKRSPNTTQKLPPSPSENINQSSVLKLVFAHRYPAARQRGIATKCQLLAFTVELSDKIILPANATRINRNVKLFFIFLVV